MSDFSINTQESEYAPSVDISKNFSDKRAQQDDAEIQRIIADMNARKPQREIKEPQKAIPRAIESATDDNSKEEVGTLEDVAVRGVVGGIRDAIQEGGIAVGELADYLTDEFGDLGALQIMDKDGNFNLDYISRDQAKREGTLARMNLPEIQQPNGIAANITRGVSQFVTGFIPALKGVKGITAGAKLTAGTKTAQAVVAGGISDFTVFDPHAERLSNLANEYPVLKNPVTEYLAADPSDGRAEGRFKNVVESLILDATLAGAFVSATKVLKSTDKLSSADAPALKEAGVPEKPMTQIIDETKPVIEEVGFKEAAEVSPTVVEFAKGSKVVDDKGLPLTVFHGGKEDIDVFDLSRVGESGTARGVGFNFTDNKDIAQSFAGDDGFVQEVALDIKKPLTMDQPPLDESTVKSLLMESAEREARDNGEDISLGFLSNYGNVDSLGLDKVVDAAVEAYMTNKTAIDQLSNLATDIESLDVVNRSIVKATGYDGVISKGFGGGDDKIFVAFTPEQIKHIPNSKSPNKGSDIPDVTDRQVDVFSAGIALERGGKAFNINLDRLDTSEDIENIINTTSKVFSKDIDEARRGTVSQADTRQAAEQIGMTPDQLLSRQQGEAFNAEGIVAARDILVSSGKNLQAMAKQIQQGEATDIQRIKFRQAVATHAAIQKQVSGLTAEAGRALQAFRIGAEDQVAQTRAINNLINQNGGRDTIDNMAEAMADIDNPAVLNKLASKSWSASSMDMVFEAWTNSLLSAPTTHMTNIVGNTLVAVSQIPERAMAAIISKMPGGSGEISFHEASGMAYGIARGAVDGWKMAKEAFKTEGMNDPLTKLDVNDRRAITAENFSRTVTGKYVVNPLLRTVGAKDLDSAGYASSFVDFVGSAVRLPGYRMLSSEDAFFKGLNYRMELNAMAYREAASAGLTGDEMAKRIVDVMENPPAHVRETSMTAADVNTFTNYNELASKVNAFRNAFPLLKFPLPFVTTPANIIAYAAKRTPLAPLARTFRDDVNAGGTRRDLALGRMATGTMAMVGFHEMAAQGLVTGKAPSDPALRTIWLQQNQEYSFKVTGEDGRTKFLAYNRLDPIGILAGVAADVYQNRNGMSKEDEDTLVGSVMISVYNNLLSKSYMTGISDIMSALDTENPQGRNISDIAANTVGGFVPNILNQMNRTFVDPTLRDTKSVNVGLDNQVSFINKTLDKINSKIPGYSKDLPARRNLWGDVIEVRQGFNDSTGEMIYNFLSPAYVTKRDPDVVNDWLIDNDIGIRMPRRKMKLQGLRKPVQLSAVEYNKYMELSGKPAKKELDRLINSKRFDQMTDDQKSDGVRKIITVFRRQAKRELLQLFPEIVIRAQNTNQ